MAVRRIRWYAACVVLGLALGAARSQQRSADRTGAIIFPDELSTRFEAAKEKRESPPDQSSAHNNGDNDDDDDYGGYGDNGDDWSGRSVELPISYALQLAELNSTNDLFALLDQQSIDPRIRMENGEFSGRDIGVVPTPGSCEPELQLVSLRPENLTGTRYYFYPTCTRVKRCSGCCNTNQLVCEPVANRTTLFKVTILEYRSGKRDRFSRLELVPVEEHVRCKCQCRVKETDCNELQVYNPNNCRCECTNKDDRTQCLQERQTKQWNPDTCSCDCIPRTEECTSGSHYDRGACKCIPNDFYTYDGSQDGDHQQQPPAVFVPHYPSFNSRKRSIIAPTPQ